MVALFVWLGETLRILKLCKKKKDICVPSGNEDGYIGEWMKGWIGELKKKRNIIPFSIPVHPTCFA